MIRYFQKRLLSGVLLCRSRSGLEYIWSIIATSSNNNINTYIPLHRDTIAKFTTYTTTTTNTTRLLINTNAISKLSTVLSRINTVCTISSPFIIKNIASHGINSNNSYNSNCYYIYKTKFHLRNPFQKVLHLLHSTRGIQNTYHKRPLPASLIALSSPKVIIHTYRIT